MAPADFHDFLAAQCHHAALVLKLGQRPACAELPVGIVSCGEVRVDRLNAVHDFREHDVALANRH